VSQTAAVITTGRAFIRFDCKAPWLKTKTFCGPKGKMRPKAKTNPCKNASNIFSLLSKRKFKG
jgi:hypothetical protein